MSDNPFVGSWTYRSLLNDPDVNTDFNNLEFGRGTIVINEAPMQLLTGTIGGPGWSLKLKGSRAYGIPMQRALPGQGHRRRRGVDLRLLGLGWCRPGRTASAGGRRWSGSVSAPSRISGGQPGTVSPAGVVASLYAVQAS